MTKLKYLFLFVFFGATIGLNAQDFHNSYFQFAPMTVNPALTGAFYGNLRLSVIGRDQGRPVAGSGNEFQDLSLALDGNVDFGFTDGDWIAFGGNFVRSDAGVSSNGGSTSFRRQFAGITAAYHLAYGRRKDKVFTIGFKYGNYSTGFNDLNGLESPFLLENGAVGADIPALSNNSVQGELPSKEKGDYNLGFMLTTPMGKKSDLRLGISADHILAPRLALTSRDTGMTQIPVNPQAERLNRRLNAFVQYYTSLSDKLTFNPNILFQQSNVSTNIVVQGLFNYLYDEEKELSFTAGIGIRPVNSLDIPIYLGADYKSWRVGIAYDANIGGLRPSTNSFGALEIGISKIFSWVKKPVVEPEFICPRL